MDKGEVVETWNKKKIFITFIIVILLGAGAYSLKTVILDKSKDFLKSVKGISIEKDDKNKSLRSNFNSSPKNTSLPLQATIKEKLDALKKEVNSLNVVDIASSSPQVQKIINDIKSLEQYPINQAKEICKQICGL